MSAPIAHAANPLLTRTSMTAVFKRVSVFLLAIPLSSCRLHAGEVTIV
jgi:hypothetical protein